MHIIDTELIRNNLANDNSGKYHLIIKICDAFDELCAINEEQRILLESYMQKFDELKLRIEELKGK